MSTLPAPSRRLHQAVWILLGLVIVGFVAVYFQSSLKHALALRENEPALPTFGSVPDFTLTERSGREVTLSELKGNIWVADFIFTTCPLLCTQMTTRMRELQEALRKTPEIKLVSFTVDTENDTPEVLSAYADRFLAKKDQWLFLTGDQETIFKVAHDGFYLGFQETSEEERPVLGRYSHSTRFALIDSQGRVRGYFDSTLPKVVDDVVAAIGVLLREERKEKP
jgi:protein SCO1/2